MTPERRCEIKAELTRDIKYLNQMDDKELSDRSYMLHAISLNAAAIAYIPPHTLLKQSGFKKAIIKRVEKDGLAMVEIINDYFDMYAEEEAE